MKPCAPSGGRPVLLDLDRVRRVERPDVVEEEERPAVDARVRVARRSGSRPDRGRDRARRPPAAKRRVVEVDHLALRPLGAAVALAQLSAKTLRGPPSSSLAAGLRRVEAAGSICAHVVSRSSASLAPCEMPWSKTFGFGGFGPPSGHAGRSVAAGEARAALHVARVVVEVGHAVARRAPVVDARVVRAVDLRVEAVERDRLARAVREDPGHAVREPGGVARRARAPGVVRLLAAERRAGRSSRMSAPTRPSSGTPSAVKNTSFPIRRAWSKRARLGQRARTGRRARSPCWPRGRGPRPRGRPRCSRRRACPCRSITTPVGMLPVWKRTTSSGAPMSSLPVASSAGAQHVVAAAAHEEERLAVAGRVDRDDVVRRRAGRGSPVGFAGLRLELDLRVQVDRAAAARPSAAASTTCTSACTFTLKMTRRLGLRADARQVEPAAADRARERAGSGRRPADRPRSPDRPGPAVSGPGRTCRLHGVG